LRSLYPEDSSAVEIPAFFAAKILEEVNLSSYVMLLLLELKPTSFFTIENGGYIAVADLLDPTLAFA